MCLLLYSIRQAFQKETNTTMLVVYTQMPKCILKETEDKKNKNIYIYILFGSGNPTLPNILVES